MRANKYSVKFAVLFIATFISIFAIWYTLVRQESVDWITSRLVRQVSPYVVAQTDDGQTVIDNVVVGYSFILPPGFKTTGAKNLSFYLDANGEKQCEIRHYYVSAEKAKAGTSTPGKITIPLKERSLIFELTGTTTSGLDCADYLRQIKTDLTMDY